MFGSLQDLSFNPISSFPRSYEWDSMTLDSHGNIYHGRSFETFGDFGDKLIEVDKSPYGGWISYSCAISFYHRFDCRRSFFVAYQLILRII